MKYAKQAGFTLVELMVVMSVVAVISSLALPKMKELTAKAKQSEVKTMMRQMYIGQTSYFAEHNSFLYLYSFGGEWGTCSNMLKFQVTNQLGLSMKPADCNLLRYTYTTNASSNNKFHASALNRQLFPNCAHSDAWTVTTDMDLRNTSNAIVDCR